MERDWLHITWGSSGGREGGGGSRSLRSWSLIHKVFELNNHKVLEYNGLLLNGKSNFNDFNLEKIAPSRRAKCNSEQIGKKKIHLFKIDKWENSVQNHFLSIFFFPLIFPIPLRTPLLQNLGFSYNFCFPTYLSNSIKNTLTPEPWIQLQDLKDLLPPSRRAKRTRTFLSFQN